MLHGDHHPWRNLREPSLWREVTDEWQALLPCSVYRLSDEPRPQKGAVRFLQDSGWVGLRGAARLPGLEEVGAESPGEGRKNNNREGRQGNI